MNWIEDFLKTLEVEYPQISKTLQKSFEINSHFDSLSKDLDILIPNDLRDFYGKVNGQQLSTENCFQFSFYLLSIERALELRTTWGQFFKSRPEDQNWWSPYWLPIMEDREGGLVVVDLKGSFDGEPGQVIELWEDWDERNIEYPSFQAMINTFTGSLQKKLWTLEDNTLIPLNDEDWMDYCEEQNPGYPFEEMAGPRSEFNEID